MGRAMASSTTQETTISSKQRIRKCTVQGKTRQAMRPAAQPLAAACNAAAIMRNVGGAAGSLTPDGKLMDQTLWKDSSTFYTAPPPPGSWPAATTRGCSG